MISSSEAKTPDELARTRHAVRCELQWLTGAYVTLKNDVDGLRADRQALQEAIELKKKELGSSQSCVKERVDPVAAALQQTIIEQSKQISWNEARLEVLQTAVAKATEELTAAQAEKAAEERRAQEHRLILAESLRRADEAEQRESDARSQLENLRASRIQAIGLIDKARREAAEARQQVEQAQKTAHEEQMVNARQSDEFQRRLGATKQEIAELTKEVSGLRAEQMQLASEIAEQEGRLALYRNAVNDMRIRHEKIQSKYELDHEQLMDKQHRLEAVIAALHQQDAIIRSTIAKTTCQLRLLQMSGIQASKAIMSPSPPPPSSLYPN